MILLVAIGWFIGSLNGPAQAHEFYSGYSGSRYQISATSMYVFVLDEATGQIWKVDSSGHAREFGQVPQEKADQ